MSALLVITSAPAMKTDDGYYLDKKFVEGMHLYASLWDGPVTALIPQTYHTFSFGKAYAAKELPFCVTLLQMGRRVEAADIARQDVILSCGDNHAYLHLANLCKDAGKTVVYTIEYIAETRRQIIFLDRVRNHAQKLYSTAWMLRQEHRRRKAFRQADGIQANGYPAFQAYAPLNRNAMLYLDSRIGADLCATENEMDAKCQRLLNGGRVRLLHSGRLEPMKGSQDLVAVAHNLRAQGVDFELNIFGSGSLEPELFRDIESEGLQEQVWLRGSVDFETELVPFARQHADIYLSCHRQSDPSCTYLENMGCGLAVAGYSNRMWSALCEKSAAGWTAPLGNTRALADVVAKAAQDRPRLADSCKAAYDFARNYLFENEFQKRVDHLAQIVGR